MLYCTRGLTYLVLLLAALLWCGLLWRGLLLQLQHLVMEDLSQWHVEIHNCIYCILYSIH